MPSFPELLGLLIVILVIWLFFKVARLAIRMILFLVGLALVGGAVYWLFLR